jgi:hypothetical protein
MKEKLVLQVKQDSVVDEKNAAAKGCGQNHGTLQKPALTPRVGAG